MGKQPVKVEPKSTTVLWREGGHDLFRENLRVSDLPPIGRTIRFLRLDLEVLSVTESIDEFDEETGLHLSFIETKRKV